VPFDLSQGITFAFNGVTYTATQIAVSRGRAEFDVSSTDIAKGQQRRLRLGKVNEVSIKVDFMGTVTPMVTATATFAVTGTDLGAADFTGKKAICTGLSITGNAGELIRGSATFKVSED
jgi:hypothetical protein